MASGGKKDYAAIALREQLAYAAGVFDGEGCISFRVQPPKRGRRESCSVKLHVGQRHPLMLERFQATVGGLGKIYTQDKEGAPFYRFQVGRYETCQAIIAMLWPWLGEVKRAQATHALTAYISFRAERGYGGIS